MPAEMLHIIRKLAQGEIERAEALRQLEAAQQRLPSAGWLPPSVLIPQACQPCGLPDLNRGNPISGEHVSLDNPTKAYRRTNLFEINGLCREKCQV